MRMRFTQESPIGAHMIRGYARGEFTIDDRRIAGGVILSATEIVVEPDMRELQDIGAERIARILAMRPEIVLLGTGATQRFPDAALLP
jgi:uncharacterized protein